MKQKITRKDGITYERKVTSEYSKKLDIRIDEKCLNGIKQLANEKNMKYSDLIRTILNEYIKQNMED